MQRVVAGVKVVDDELNDIPWADGHDVRPKVVVWRQAAPQAPLEQRGPGEWQRHSEVVEVAQVLPVGGWVLNETACKGASFVHASERTGSSRSVRTGRRVIKSFVPQ